MLRFGGLGLDLGCRVLAIGFRFKVPGGLGLGCRVLAIGFRFKVSGTRIFNFKAGLRDQCFWGMRIYLDPQITLPRVP